MKQIVVELSKLKTDFNNVRLHGESQLRELLKSVKQFGQTRAIVIDEDNNVLIGNGLCQAMRLGGYETANAYMMEGLTEKEKKKLMLSDNKIFSLGLDNNEEIQRLIDDISSGGDYDIPGFDEDILKEMTRTIDEVKEDMFSYGELPISRIEKIKERSESIPEGSAREETQISRQERYAPMEQEREVRKVICPSCGEVIYLD